MSFIPGIGIRIARKGQKLRDPSFVCDRCNRIYWKRTFEDIPPGWIELPRGQHHCTICAHNDPFDQLKEHKGVNMEYSIESSYEQNCLVIHAKPSQIPYSIDLFLIRLAGESELNGINNRVSYFFRNVEKLKQAEEYLIRCSFSKKG